MISDDDVTNILNNIIAEQKRRYSEQPDPNYFLCRDCGSIVKSGWLGMHDGMHAVINWPDYEEYEDDA